MPTLKLPLSRSLLNDPAFSPDPRSHPHFQLAHANSYKSIPSSPTNVLPALPPRIPRKARMKALVRRLTTRHNLDRIDELDETDPFGTGYHHHGPYESISTNLASAAPPAPSFPRPSKRQSDPLPLRPALHHSASRLPSAIRETGLSLHLEPGQILQHNTIYTSYASRPALVHKPNAPPILSQPYLARSQPPQMRPEDYSSLDLPPHTFQNQPSPSLRAPQERYSGNKPYHMSDSLAPHRDHDATFNAPYRIEKNITRPPRYESKFYSSGPPQSPQPPSIIFTPQIPQLTKSPAPPLPPRGSSLCSLDVSCAVNTAITQSSSAIQHKPLEPPRTRHLPKRLVMPTPLQTQQPPPPQHNHLPAGAPAWQGRPHSLQGARFEEKPAMYTQKPRLLRKKSSTLHAKTPIPDHVPMSKNYTTPIRASYPSKTTDEAKERTRRRLSKRKDDI